MVAIEPRIVSILWGRNPIWLEHVFLVPILNYKPCRVPHKHRCPIKKSGYSKAHAIKVHCHLFGVGMIGQKLNDEFEHKKQHCFLIQFEPQKRRYLKSWKYNCTIINTSSQSTTDELSMAFTVWLKPKMSMDIVVLSIGLDWNVGEQWGWPQMWIFHYGIFMAKLVKHVKLGGDLNLQENWHEVSTFPWSTHKMSHNFFMCFMMSMALLPVFQGWSMECIFCIL